MTKLHSALFIILTLLIGVAYLAFSRSPLYNQPSSKNQQTYKNIKPAELKSYLDESKDIFLLDVHIPEQIHINGTDDFIPFNKLEKYQSKLPKDKSTEIVVYCRSGNMSEIASDTLIDLGYKNVKNLSGGTNAWKSNGYSL